MNSYMKNDIDDFNNNIANLKDTFNLDMDVLVEQVYTCKFCGLFTHQNLELTKEHQIECRFNWKCNNNCATCNHVAVELIAPYPRNRNKYRTKDIIDEIGSYSKYVCTKKGRSKHITETELLSNERECWVKNAFKEVPQIRNKQYDIYEDTIMLAIKEGDEIQEAITYIQTEMPKYKTKEEQDKFILEYQKELTK